MLLLLVNIGEKTNVQLSILTLPYSRKLTFILCVFPILVKSICHFKAFIAGIVSEITLTQLSVFGGVKCSFTAIFLLMLISHLFVSITVSYETIKIRIIMSGLGFYDREVQGQDGAYFATNEKGHIWWLDNMANDGIQWELVK